MLVLALDSSSSVASVAMVEFSASHEEEKTLYCYHQPHARTDSSIFFNAMQQALEEHGKPDRIVVGLGPGSYNGLRSSVAAAQGIASACNIELIGISSALALENKSYWIAGDARGGQYWLAAVLNHEFTEEPFLLSPVDVPGHLATRPDFPLLAYGALPQLPASQNFLIKTPDAVILATLGKNATATKLLTPLYLKPANVTLRVT